MTKAAIFIFFTALVLRLAFLSPWLEDWDSVQFALALQNFDISLHQPHPPGYPLYILLGRLINLFLQNDNLSFTVLSALFGTLTIIPLYFLTQKMFNKKTATWASIFFAATPIVWMMSEVALTNIVGLFFLTLFAYLLYICRDQLKRLVFVTGLGGFILGFRFTELPIITALLALVYLKRRNLKQAAVGAVTFLAGVSLWVLPILFDTGVRNFISEYSWIANYVIRHDTLQGGTWVSFTLLTTRLSSLWHIMTIGYTPYFLLLSAVSLVWFLKEKKSWRKISLQFLLVWLVAYAIPSVFFYNLEVPRYTLPYSVPLAIFTAHMLASAKQTRLPVVVFLLAAVLMFRQGWSQVIKFKNTIPPTIAPVLYVKENFSPEDTILITTFTFRQFQYYAREFTTYYGSYNTPEGLNPEKVVIDFLGLKDKIPALASYELVTQKEFSGPSAIFPRVPKTNLYVLKKNE